MSHTQLHTPGPLLAAWGSAATVDAVERQLLPPPDALPTLDLGGADWHRSAASTLSMLSAEAEAERGTPWPQPLASHYARYFRDGVRTAHEDRVFARQHRLTRAVVMAAVTGEDAWVDEAADGVVLLCEQSSWCWAAHDHSPRKNGTVLPDPDDPHLDLGAGEVAAQLAWADHTLGTAFDHHVPGLRARIRREVEQRVLAPFLQRDDWHWLGWDGNVHNWCPWICGNVLVAGLRLIDDEHRRARVVVRALEGVDRYLAALPTDGSVDEGYEYWWNGACRALEALDVLAYATSGALDATRVPTVRETIAFPHRMHLGGEWYLNLADARARPPGNQPWHVLHRWALRIGNEEAARHAASHRVPGPAAYAEYGLGRLLGALTDADWLDAEPASPPLVASVWLPGTQVSLARETAGSPRGLTLAVKGGHNDENHNHNDVGSVVVAVDGVPVLIDAGRPTYTAQTFSPDRYSIWTMQSSWHNVPEVRGTPQSQGRAFHARDMTRVDDGRLDQVRLDLSAAYPATGLERWWRTATLDRHSQRVTIEDAWTFAGGEMSRTSPVGAAEGQAPTVVHYLLAGDVETPAPGRLVIRPLGGARTILLTWDPAHATSHVSTAELHDPMLTGVWGKRVRRLELRVPDDVQGTLVITAEVRA
ncbi:heparinase II/III family protein [Phytoactinopolyspora mesophila]|nr:heparinase II/III family protein [Phytoactinopolyspora mesophila]